jgi:hypothetical protein
MTGIVKVGRDFSIHLAARALAYYAVSGGFTRLDSQQVVRRSAMHYWGMLHLTVKPNWDRQYSVDGTSLKRALIACYIMRPAAFSHMLEPYGVRLVLEQYDAQDQQKLVTILESRNDLGYNKP